MDTAYYDGTSPVYRGEVAGGGGMSGASLGVENALEWLPYIGSDRDQKPLIFKRFGMTNTHYRTSETKGLQPKDRLTNSDLDHRNNFAFPTDITQEPS